MADADKEVIRRRCLEVVQILRSNYVGAHRALICATNEFRHWQPSEVEALWKLLPDLELRKLSPHGPESRHVPRGGRRWAELAMKTAVIGAVDAAALVASPLALLSKTVRQEALPGLIKLNYESIGSSFFVKCPLDLLRQAAHAGMAVCVSRGGDFSVRSSGYAAISHAWAETMGLEYNDEKVDHDDRGINYKHFGRIISDAVASTGHHWFWLDLLAVPQIKGDEPDVQMLRELKTNVINSLIHVYRNADAVVILDSLTLQLSTPDLCAVAAIFSCGRWLTRMWTYQEIKLARKALVVTRTGAVDFEEMVNALHVRKSESEAAYKHWHEIHLKLMRLLPSDPRGVSLADVAFCCGDRNAENDIDYARSLFALLDLKWETGWTYEQAILHIVMSRPQDTARIANLQGMRGLPAPYSWAPRYLARLTGMIIGGYTATKDGLVGSWTTFRVNRVITLREHQNEPKHILHLELLSQRGEPFEMWSELPQGWTHALDQWREQARPAGSARLLCAKVPENMRDDHDPVIMLMVLQDGAETCGTVVGTLALNDPDVHELDGERLQWLLA